MDRAQDSAIYQNADVADPNGWSSFETTQESAHSRLLEIIEVKGQKKSMIASGGHMTSGADNYVSIGVIKVPY